MSLLTVAADMGELREIRLALVRIAEAFERLSPPLPATISDAETPSEAERASRDRDQVFHLAESPEQYQERTNKEAALAISLGVAPWSPAFQQVIHDYRQDLLRPRMVKDEEGNETEAVYSEAEAEDIIRQAFQLAKAEANKVTGTGSKG